MLVLSRKRDEGIILTTPGGERIRVLVVEIRGDRDQVRIGIDAPRSVIAHREEIQNQIDNGYDRRDGGPCQ